MNKDSTGQSILSNISNSKNYFILFIIWPFMAFLLAISNFSQKEAKKVVYMFLIYYGFTFVNNNENVDAFRYALNLESNALLPFSDFFRIVGGLNTDTNVDIIEPFISFIVSRFTSNSSLYFAIWAAIFGFFYLKSINLLFIKKHEDPGWNSTIILIFFILILPITSISGVRMWTAAWMFFYGAYHVVLNREPRYLLITLASSFLHWSFFAANAILLIYYFAGNRNIIYLPITLASFIVPKLIAPLFQSISLSLGGAYQKRYEGYSSEEYLLIQQESSEQSTWFLKIGGDIVFYYLIFAIVVIQLWNGSKMKGKDERNLFSFLLLFLSFVNFGMSIPSLGSRFQILFFLFATLYLFIFSLKLPRERISLLTLIGLFPMFLYAAINFRLGSESISAWLLAPGFGVPFLAPVLSLSEMLFQ
jgi:hypothetical protein